MTIKNKGLTIELENENEIEIFWNVVAFALDLHNERIGKGKSCMSDEELQMANRLFNATKEKL